MEIGEVAIELRVDLSRILCKFQPEFSYNYTNKKTETTHLRIHQFTNLKCDNMSFKAFKIKKQGLKCFIIINNTQLERGFGRNSGLYAAL